MARGSVVGEPINSQASTDEFRKGYERVFGDRKPVRGRFVYDPAQGKCVPAEEYRPEPLALNAPIIADRIHEGTAFDFGDGDRDIGSRRKRREAMKAYGVEDATDATPAWREEQKKQREREDDRNRRAAMQEAARKLYAQGKWIADRTGAARAAGPAGARAHAPTRRPRARPLTTARVDRGRERGSGRARRAS